MNSLEAKPVRLFIISNMKRWFTWTNLIGSLLTNLKWTSLLSQSRIFRTWLQSELNIWPEAPLCQRPSNRFRKIIVVLYLNSCFSFVFHPSYKYSFLFQIKYALLLCCVAAVSVAQTQRPAVSDTALEDALQDKRFIQRQLKCALGEAPCDPIGKRLKSKLIIEFVIYLFGFIEWFHFWNISIIQYCSLVK